jgi:hypothetical protein
MFSLFSTKFRPRVKVMDRTGNLTLAKRETCALPSDSELKGLLPYQDRTGDLTLTIEPPHARNYILCLWLLQLFGCHSNPLSFSLSLPHLRYKCNRSMPLCYIATSSLVFSFRYGRFSPRFWNGRCTGLRASRTREGRRLEFELSRPVQRAQFSRHLHQDMWANLQGHNAEDDSIRSDSP